MLYILNKQFMLSLMSQLAYTFYLHVLTFTMQSCSTVPVRQQNMTLKML